MLKYNDYSKILLLSDTDDNVHIRKKSIYSTLLKYILPILIVIILVIFVILAYMEFEPTEINEYNRPITWVRSNISQENIKIGENTSISTTLLITTLFITTPTPVDQKPFFIKHPKTRDLQCDRLYGNNSKRYIEQLILPNSNLSYTKSRITYKDEADLKTDCESIKKRNYFPMKPRNEVEAHFPLAFARVVNSVC